MSWIAIRPQAVVTTTDVRASNTPTRDGQTPTAGPEVFLSIEISALTQWH